MYLFYIIYLKYCELQLFYYLKNNLIQFTKKCMNHLWNSWTFAQAVHSRLVQWQNDVWMMEALFESHVLCFRCRGLVPSPHPKVSYGLPSQEPQVGAERQILWDKVKEGTVNYLSRKLLTSEGSDCRLRSFNLCLNSSYVAHAL